MQERPVARVTFNILKQRVVLDEEEFDVLLIIGSIQPRKRLYKVHAKQVIVYVVADGRRDMGSLLAGRLLGA